MLLGAVEAFSINGSSALRCPRRRVATPKLTQTERFNNYWKSSIRWMGLLNVKVNYGWSWMYKHSTILPQKRWNVHSCENTDKVQLMKKSQPEKSSSSENKPESVMQNPSGEPQAKSWSTS
ncbi:hypothetical protein NE237_026859 [Protea cynaroides]|uniref:Uncharacterized protein n=1 Tax=Protea cynaroides TaxID=273540 RepID=A0A9Q0JSN1_9MAGN|nr:hypothetical protein NE237_026859 [Protea cynaroides]